MNTQPSASGGVHAATPEMTVTQLRALTQKAQDHIAHILNALMRETGLTASVVTYQTQKDNPTGHTRAINVKISVISEQCSVASEYSPAWSRNSLNTDH